MATLANIYAPTPTTVRGKAVNLGADPKGNNFLYCTGNAVVIRNIKNPLIADLYYEHPAATTVAKYAPSGYYIASGDVVGNIRIWDTTQKEHILKIELKILSGPISDIAWSGDNQRLIVVGEGKERFGAAFIWDTGASVGEIGGHSKSILSCDFKPTRPFRVITGSEDMTVGWHEGPPFKFVRAFKDFKRFVNCTRFSPDGNRAIAVGSDKKGFFFDGKTGEKIGELAAEAEHGGGIYSASWSPDSKQVLTASGDKTAKLWDAGSGQCLATFTFGDGSEKGLENQQLGSLWQGEFILTVNLNGDISYLDPANPGRPRRILRGHNKPIISLGYDHHTKLLYSGSYDAQIVQWESATGNTEPFIGQGHANSITAIKIQAGHLITCSMDDTVRITPLATRHYEHSIPLDAQPSGIAVGRRHEDLIVVSTNKTILVIRAGKIVHSTPAPFEASAVALSIDETTVAVGGKDNKIRIFSLDGNVLKQTHVLEKHRGVITSLEFSPDGQWLASSDTNREILVWDNATHNVKVEGWVFHTARVNKVAWSPDSIHLASGSLDTFVYVWDVQKPNNRIAIKLAHQGGVTDLVWLSENTVASAGQDATIKTWNLKY
eukprot:TRINITY_DN657_c0_g1_i1.p1 TRINITY_DN657_c0_g1~~TRINITY_DN657_c0_g1_i1.p1  ORF type:complete len:605 (-),score=128.08 TRINITY_DN657_c0_g1_i1:125-1939(-)